jgi:hypothetical protein
MHLIKPVFLDDVQIPSCFLIRHALFAMWIFYYRFYGKLA